MGEPAAKKLKAGDEDVPSLEFLQENGYDCVSKEEWIFFEDLSCWKDPSFWKLRFDRYEIDQFKNSFFTLVMTACVEHRKGTVNRNKFFLPFNLHSKK